MALLVALSFVVVGCDTGGGTKVNKDLKDKVIEGADIVLTPIGGDTAKIVITGNKFKLDGQTGATSQGFSYAFPTEVIGVGYKAIKVEVKLLSIVAPDFISFNAKTDTQMGTDVLILGHNKQYHGELKIGTIVDKALDAPCDDDACLQYTPGTCIVGATGAAEYPMNKFTNLIAFQYNPWAGDITTAGWSSSTGTAEFEIEVTKITFIGNAPDEAPPEPPLEAGSEFFYDLAGYTAGADYTVDFSKVTLGDEVELVNASDASQGVINKTGTLDGTTSTVVAFKLIYPTGFNIEDYTFISVTSVAIDGNGDPIAAAGSLGTGKLIKDATNKWSTELTPIYNLGTTWSGGNNPMNHPIELTELPQAFNFGAGSATVKQIKITEIKFHTVSSE